MALPSTAANAAQVESGARASARPASPLSSGLPTYSSVPQSGRPPQSSQQQGSSLPRQSLDLGGPQQSQPNSVNEGGKEATTHDFLSLHGSGSASSTQTTAARGLTSSVTTQDFLHPLEKATKSTSGSLFSQGVVAGASRVHASSADFVTPQQTSFALVNGTLELPSSVLYRVDRGEAVADGMKERLESLAQWTSMPLKFRSSDVSYASKAHVPQAVPLMNKQWQQQQVGSDFFDVSKRPPRVPSEDDDDDDNEESMDRGLIPKKEILHQKCRPFGYYYENICLVIQSGSCDLKNRLLNFNKMALKEALFKTIDCKCENPRNEVRNA